MIDVATRPDRAPHVVALATLAELGGAERSLVELVRHTGDRLRWTVVLPDAGPLADAAVAAGAASRVVPWPASVAGLGERSAGSAVLGRALRAGAGAPRLWARLAREARALAPDVVVTNGIKAHVLGAAMAGRIGAPVVWYAREGLEDRPWSRSALRLAARRVAGVIAISRYVASELRPLVPPSRPIHVVRNIVDVARLRPGLPCPADLAKAPGELWIGVVGALTPLKAQDVFLDAAARIAADVPEARFLVVGGEPYRTEAGLGFAAALRRRAARLGSRVRFLGERDDAGAVIANLDVLVQPSRGPEGLGRTILEAMACGVAVVTVDRWGPRELVRDGETGLLVAPGSVDALAAALRRVAGDAPLRARLGAAGRKALLADGAPDALAGAFCEALASVARLPAPAFRGVKEMAVGGR
jgi:glycosyltransferase involved in cell wall biosynthesis